MTNPWSPQDFPTPQAFPPPRAFPPPQGFPPPLYSRPPRRLPGLELPILGSVGAMASTFGAFVLYGGSIAFADDPDVARAIGQAPYSPEHPQFLLTTLSIAGTLLVATFALHFCKTRLRSGARFRAQATAVQGVCTAVAIICPLIWSFVAIAAANHAASQAAGG